MPLVSFYTPWKQRKNSDYLMFSGGKERDKWHEMGQWEMTFVGFVRIHRNTELINVELPLLTSDRYLPTVMLKNKWWMLTILNEPFENLGISISATALKLALLKFCSRFTNFYFKKWAIHVQHISIFFLVRSYLSATISYSSIQKHPVMFYDKRLLRILMETFQLHIDLEVLFENNCRSIWKFTKNNLLVPASIKWSSKTCISEDWMPVMY